MTAEARKKASEMVEKARKEDERLVKGVFKNLKIKGGDVKFPYKAYKGEPLRIYTFKDGEEYEIPIGVARHINRDCRRKIHSYLVDKDGAPYAHPTKHEQLAEFVSTEFM